MKEIKKNLAYIHALSPSYLPLAIIIMLFQRVRPFVVMILSAKIVDMVLIVIYLRVLYSFM